MDPKIKMIADIFQRFKRKNTAYLGTIAYITEGQPC